jgi:tetratricopeptide (TPR) repeat protein
VQDMGDYSEQVQRNLTAIKLEKLGRVDEAIRLYEANVEESFDGSHPYTRLATIYRKRKQIDDEIRVLEKAIWIYEDVVQKERDGRELKLAVFKKRLEKARQLKLAQEHRG